MADFNTANTYSNAYSTYCGNRLPCGICRLTRERCYDNAWQPSITWNGTGDVPTVNFNEVTCNTENK